MSDRRPPGDDKEQGKTGKGAEVASTQPFRMLDTLTRSDSNQPIFAQFDFSTRQFHGTPEFLIGHRLPGDDGIYAGWKWDGAELQIETDRYGMHPMFYFVEGRKLWIAPRLEDLIRLGAPTDWDDDAIAVFLRLGCYVADTSPLRAVRALPARPQIIEEGDRIVVRSRVFSRPPCRLTRTQVLDAYIDLFRASVAKRLPDGPIALALSGGRDSRHILLALCELGRSPDVCITARHFPQRGDDDVEVARELCHRFGIPHLIVDHPPRRLEAELGKNRETHFCTDEHAQMLPIAEWLRRNRFAAYDGIGGDVLSEGHRRRPEAVGMVRRSAIDELAIFMIDGYDPTIEGALRKALTSEAYKRFSRDRAIGRIARDLKTHMEEPDPIASFFFWNRTRREVALTPYALMRSAQPVFAPFLDGALFDLLASLPLVMTLDRRLHGDAIARGYPHVEDIRYERPDFQKSSRAHFRRLALDMTLYAFMEGERSAWFRPAYVLKGAALAAARGNDDSLWFLPRAICLLQLQRLLASISACAANLHAVHRQTQTGG
jgi:asparagine synthase (glutamine-hydrolysing)